MTHALPPVVLLISIDTLRQDHLGCYGYHRNTTPFIDSLAAQGRQYQRAFTPVPVTLPAHTCIFTARYPGWSDVAVHNMTRLHTASTWVSWLNSSGVLTAGFISGYGLDRKFTRCFDLSHYDDLNQSDSNLEALKRRAESTVSACLQWFTETPKDLPIFCFLHLYDAHISYDVPEPIASQFVQKQYDEEPLSITQLYSPGGIPEVARLDKMGDFPGKHAAMYYIDRYDGCIAYTDKQIRHLVHSLHRMFNSRLVVIITADHGEAFGEDDIWCQHTLTVFPNQTQIPFIVWSSGRDKIARLVDASKPMSLLDIGPTVLDIFGAADNPQERHHGWSLFDHTKEWATRRLFSISFSQILAYDAEYGEGAVIGMPLSGLPIHPKVRLDKSQSYFNHEMTAASDSIAEGILFHNLATTIGTRVKPIAATYFERQDEGKIVRRLADLGYIGNVPSQSDTENINQYILALPVLQGTTQVTLPLRAETLTRELQVRPALHLGCGASKILGFFGLDRYPMPGVDVVGDLNASLPFPDDSFDLIFASHALERVQDLTATMHEIYRVCKHGAQVCIVAPYALQGLTLANPYYRHVFNEHTPRFWTNAAHTLVAAAEYAHPQAPSWGLAESDKSQPGIDFHCLRMECFYFPAYRHLPEAEQRAARKKYTDVCDQIMYHLIVVKEPISEAEMQEVATRTEYYEPPYVAMRRLEERLEAQETALDQTRATLGVSEKVLAQVRAEAAAQAAALVQAHAAEVAQVRAALREQATDLAHVRTTLQTRESELAHIRGVSQTCETELAHTRVALHTRVAELEHLSKKGQSITAEVDAYRQRRIMRWLNHLENRSDASNDIAPAFQQLKDDSLIFTKGLAGFLLQPSGNLQHVPFLYYPLTLGRANLQGMLLAPIVDFPLTGGVLGIEIVSPSNTIVTQAVVPAQHLSDTAPTRFDFAPMRDADQGRFWLRVFVRDVDGPVRLFEWRKYSRLKWGAVQTRAFCGFVFQE